jgi:hypothetical protein
MLEWIWPLIVVLHFSEDEQMASGWLRDRGDGNRTELI